MSERYLLGAWRFMRLRPFPCALCLALTLVATASAGSSRSTLDRSAVDRPDDVNGAQIHAIYVLPSDGTDASSDTNGGIAQDIFSWTDWLETQASGQALRIDTYQGQPDVSFVRIPETAEAAKANGGYALWTTIVNGIRAASFVDPEKRYAVYYGGPGTTISAAPEVPSPAQATEFFSASTRGRLDLGPDSPMPACCMRFFIRWASFRAARHTTSAVMSTTTRMTSCTSSAPEAFPCPRRWARRLLRSAYSRVPGSL